MEKFCPHYPKPLPKKPPLWRMFFSKRRSWLDALYERSYDMKMGEVHLPGIDLYMVNEPALVRRIMVEEVASFPKHPLLGDALRPLLGDSIFTTNGATWKRQRSMMEPSFEAARVRRVFVRMLDAVSAMSDRLHALPPGSVHDLELEMTHVAADVILRTILSVNMDSVAAKQVFDAFSRFQALAPRLMMPALFGLRWWRPWGLRRQSQAAAAEIRTLLADWIRPRFDAAQALSTSALAPGEGEKPEDDLLSGLLAAVDEKTGARFSFEELVDQVAMLFLAGHETSASALGWALHLLANAPDIQEQLHREARQHWKAVVADPSALKSMRLARNVFRETLRLFPPVGFLARQAGSDCEMRGKRVSAGASVVVSPWLIQRHRKMWKDADVFDPFRYEETVMGAGIGTGMDGGNSTRESLRTAYLPFGLGARVCIGAAFALQEASLVLASLTREFRFEPVEGEVPQPVGRLTIRAEHGIRLRIWPREPET